MKNLFLYILTCMAVFTVSAQSPRPADPQSGPIAITNATVHVGDGSVVEGGTVLFENGKITAVNTSAAPSGYAVIDAAGKHVYPGLILPSTNTGLEEISAVRPTMDVNEVGSITPNVRSQIAFNTESALLPTFRFNGILTAQPTPRGGLVTGTSSIMMMDGWNWEDATLVKDDAIHVNWPVKSYGPRWWMGETERRPNKNYDNQLASITDLFRDAKAYLEGSPSEVNLKLEAMRGVFDGSKRVFVSAGSVKNIVASVTTLKSAGVAELTIVGGRDAHYVIDLLKEHDVSVILNTVHRMPSREEEDVDLPFRLPGILHDAGVLVGLRHQGMLGRARNLPFYAGTAAAHGMEKEEALKLITSNTAKILGVDDQLGTVEEGKDATLIIVEGDLLDMRTSIITRAFIQGRDVAIEGKQQILYERFKEKYGE